MTQPAGLIRNGFVFVPAMSFARDDQGNENLSTQEIGAVPAPIAGPALTPGQQTVLRQAYDANPSQESNGGIDGIWLDMATAVQWGLLPAPELPGSAPLDIPHPHPQPQFRADPATAAPQAQQRQKTNVRIAKPNSGLPRISRPQNLQKLPRFVPPGYE